MTSRFAHIAQHFFDLHERDDLPANPSRTAPAELPALTSPHAHDYTKHRSASGQSPSPLHQPPHQLHHHRSRFVPSPVSSAASTAPLSPSAISPTIRSANVSTSPQSTRGNTALHFPLPLPRGHGRESTGATTSTTLNASPHTATVGNHQQQHSAAMASLQEGDRISLSFSEVSPPLRVGLSASRSWNAAAAGASEPSFLYTPRTGGSVGLGFGGPVDTTTPILLSLPATANHTNSAGAATANRSHPQLQPHLLNSNAMPMTAEGGAAFSTARLSDADRELLLSPLLHYVQDEAVLCYMTGVLGRQRMDCVSASVASSHFAQCNAAAPSPTPPPPPPLSRPQSSLQQHSTIALQQDYVLNAACSRHLSVALHQAMLISSSSKRASLASVPGSLEHRSCSTWEPPLNFTTVASDSSPPLYQGNSSLYLMELSMQSEYGMDTSNSAERLRRIDRLPFYTRVTPDQGAVEKMDSALPGSSNRQFCGNDQQSTTEPTSFRGFYGAPGMAQPSSASPKNNIAPFSLEGLSIATHHNIYANYRSLTLRYAHQSYEQLPARYRAGLDAIITEVKVQHELIRAGRSGAAMAATNTTTTNTSNTTGGSGGGGGGGGSTANAAGRSANGNPPTGVSCSRRIDSMEETISFIGVGYPSPNCSPTPHTSGTAQAGAAYNTPASGVGSASDTRAHAPVLPASGGSPHYTRVGEESIWSQRPLSRGVGVECHDPAASKGGPNAMMASVTSTPCLAGTTTSTSGSVHSLVLQLNFTIHGFISRGEQEMALHFIMAIAPYRMTFLSDSDRVLMLFNHIRSCLPSARLGTVLLAMEAWRSLYRSSIGASSSDCVHMTRELLTAVDTYLCHGHTYAEYVSGLIILQAVLVLSMEGSGFGSHTASVLLRHRALIKERVPTLLLMLWTILMEMYTIDDVVRPPRRVLRDLAASALQDLFTVALELQMNLPVQNMVANAVNTLFGGPQASGGKSDGVSPPLAPSVSVSVTTVEPDMMPEEENTSFIAVGAAQTWSTDLEGLLSSDAAAALVGSETSPCFERVTSGEVADAAMLLEGRTSQASAALLEQLSSSPRPPEPPSFRAPPAPSPDASGSRYSSPSLLRSFRSAVARWLPRHRRSPRMPQVAAPSTSTAPPVLEEASLPVRPPDMRPLLMEISDEDLSASPAHFYRGGGTQPTPNSTADARGGGTPLLMSRLLSDGSAEPPLPPPHVAATVSQANSVQAGAPSCSATDTPPPIGGFFWNSIPLSVGQRREFLWSLPLPVALREAGRPASLEATVAASTLTIGAFLCAWRLVGNDVQLSSAKDAAPCGTRTGPSSKWEIQPPKREKDGADTVNDAATVRRPGERLPLLTPEVATSYWGGHAAAAATVGVSTVADRSGALKSSSPTRLAVSIGSMDSAVDSLEISRSMLSTTMVAFSSQVVPPPFLKATEMDPEWRSLEDAAANVYVPPVAALPQMRDGVTGGLAVVAAHPEPQSSTSLTSSGATPAFSVTNNRAVDITGDTEEDGVAATAAGEIGDRVMVNEEPSLPPTALSSLLPPHPMRHTGFSRKGSRSAGNTSSCAAGSSQLTQGVSGLADRSGAPPLQVPPVTSSPPLFFFLPEWAAAEVFDLCLHPSWPMMQGGVDPTDHHTSQSTPATASSTSDAGFPAATPRAVNEAAVVPEEDTCVVLEALMPLLSLYYFDVLPSGDLVAATQVLVNRAIASMKRTVAAAAAAATPNMTEGNTPSPPSQRGSCTPTTLLSCDGRLPPPAHTVAPCSTLRPEGSATSTSTALKELGCTIIVDDTDTDREGKELEEAEEDDCDSVLYDGTTLTNVTLFLSTIADHHPDLFEMMVSGKLYPLLYHALLIPTPRDDAELFLLAPTTSGKRGSVDAMSGMCTMSRRLAMPSLIVLAHNMPSVDCAQRCLPLVDRLMQVGMQRPFALDAVTTSACVCAVFPSMSRGCQAELVRSMTHVLTTPDDAVTTEEIALGGGVGEELCEIKGQRPVRSARREVLTSVPGATASLSGRLTKAKATQLPRSGEPGSAATEEGAAVHPESMAALRAPLQHPEAASHRRQRATRLRLLKHHCFRSMRVFPSSWEGTTLFFLEVCLPYFYHRDAQLRMECVQCCMNWLLSDCWYSMERGLDSASSTLPLLSMGGDRMLAMTSDEISPPLCGPRGNTEPCLAMTEGSATTSLLKCRSTSAPPLSRPSVPGDAIVVSSADFKVGEPTMESTFHIVHHGRTHVNALREVVHHLVELAVSDPEPLIRRCALESLTPETYQQLYPHEQVINQLFIVMFDSYLPNRLRAAELLSILAPMNPISIYPRLRQAMVQCIEDLNVSVVTVSQGGGRTVVGPLRSQSPGAATSESPYNTIPEDVLCVLSLLAYCLKQSTLLYLPGLLSIVSTVLRHSTVSPRGSVLQALHLLTFLCEDSAQEEPALFEPFTDLVAQQLIDGEGDNPRLLAAVSALQSLLQSTETTQRSLETLPKVVECLHSLLYRKPSVGAEFSIAILRLLTTISSIEPRHPEEVHKVPALLRRPQNRYALPLLSSLIGVVGQRPLIGHSGVERVELADTAAQALAQFQKADRFQPFTAKAWPDIVLRALMRSASGYLNGTMSLTQDGLKECLAAMMNILTNTMAINNLELYLPTVLSLVIDLLDKKEPSDASSERTHAGEPTLLWRRRFTSPNTQHISGLTAAVRPTDYPGSPIASGGGTSEAIRQLFLRGLLDLVMMTGRHIAPMYPLLYIFLSQSLQQCSWRGIIQCCEVLGALCSVVPDLVREDCDVWVALLMNLLFRCDTVVVTNQRIGYYARLDTPTTGTASPRQTAAVAPQAIPRDVGQSEETDDTMWAKTEASAVNSHGAAGGLDRSGGRGSSSDPIPDTSDEDEVPWEERLKLVYKAVTITLTSLEPLAAPIARSVTCLSLAGCLKSSHVLLSKRSAQQSSSLPSSQPPGPFTPGACERWGDVSSVKLAPAPPPGVSTGSSKCGDNAPVFDLMNDSHEDLISFINVSICGPLLKFMLSGDLNTTSIRVVSAILSRLESLAVVHAAALRCCVASNGNHDNVARHLKQTDGGPWPSPGTLSQNVYDLAGVDRAVVERRLRDVRHAFLISSKDGATASAPELRAAVERRWFLESPLQKLWVESTDTEKMVQRFFPFSAVETSWETAGEIHLLGCLLVAAAWRHPRTTLPFAPTLLRYVSHRFGPDSIVLPFVRSVCSTYYDLHVRIEPYVAPEAATVTNTSHQDLVAQDELADVVLQNSQMERTTADSQPTVARSGTILSDCQGGSVRSAPYSGAREQLPSSHITLSSPLVQATGDVERGSAGIPSADVRGSSALAVAHSGMVSHTSSLCPAVPADPPSSSGFSVPLVPMEMRGTVAMVPRSFTSISPLTADIGGPSPGALPIPLRGSGDRSSREARTSPLAAAASGTFLDSSGISRLAQCTNTIAITTAPVGEREVAVVMPAVLLPTGPSHNVVPGSLSMSAIRRRGPFSLSHTPQIPHTSSSASLWRITSTSVSSFEESHSGSPLQQYGRRRCSPLVPTATPSFVDPLGYLVPSESADRWDAEGARMSPGRHGSTTSPWSSTSSNAFGLGFCVPQASAISAPGTAGSAGAAPSGAVLATFPTPAGWNPTSFLGSQGPPISTSPPAFLHPTLQQHSGGELCPSPMNDHSRCFLLVYFDLHRLLPPDGWQSWWEQLCLHMIENSFDYSVKACEKFARHHHVAFSYSELLPIALLSTLPLCSIRELVEWLKALRRFYSYHRDARSPVPQIVASGVARIAHYIWLHRNTFFSPEVVRDYVDVWLPAGVLADLAHHSLNPPLRILFMEADLARSFTWPKTAHLMAAFDDATISLDRKLFVFSDSFRQWLLETAASPRPTAAAHQLHLHFSQRRRCETSRGRLRQQQQQQRTMDGGLDPAESSSIVSASPSFITQYPLWNSAEGDPSVAKTPAIHRPIPAAQLAVSSLSISALCVETLSPAALELLGFYWAAAKHYIKEYMDQQRQKETSSARDLSSSNSGETKRTASCQQSAEVANIVGAMRCLICLYDFDAVLRLWDTIREGSGSPMAALFGDPALAAHEEGSMQELVSEASPPIPQEEAGSKPATPLRRTQPVEVTSEMARYVAVSAHALSRWDYVMESVKQALGSQALSSSSSPSGGNLSDIRRRTLGTDAELLKGVKGAAGSPTSTTSPSSSLLDYTSGSLLQRQMEMLFAAAFAAQRDYTNAKKAMQVVRDGLRDSYAVFHTDNTRVKLEWSCIFQQLSDLEESLHALELSANADGGLGAAMNDGELRLVDDSSLCSPQTSDNLRLGRAYNEATQRRLRNIAGRPLTASGSVLQRIAVLGARATISPMNWQRGNIFALAELIERDGQPMRAVQILHHYGQQPVLGVHAEAVLEYRQHLHLEMLRRLIRNLHHEADVREVYACIRSTLRSSLQQARNATAAVTKPTAPSMPPLFGFSATNAESPADSECILTVEELGHDLTRYQLDLLLLNVECRRQLAHVLLHSSKRTATRTTGSLPQSRVMEVPYMEVAENSYNVYPHSPVSPAMARQLSTFPAIPPTGGTFTAGSTPVSRSEAEDVTSFNSLTAENTLFKEYFLLEHAVAVARYTPEVWREFGLLLFDVCIAIHEEWTNTDDAETKNNFLRQSAKAINALQQASQLWHSGSETTLTSGFGPFPTMSQRRHRHARTTLPAAHLQLRALHLAITCEEVGRDTTQGASAAGSPSSGALGGGDGAAVDRDGAGVSMANGSPTSSVLHPLPAPAQGGLSSLDFSESTYVQWATVSPFLVSAATRHAELYTVIGEMCAKSRPMLRQLMFLMLSSFEHPYETLFPQRISQLRALQSYLATTSRDPNGLGSRGGGGGAKSTAVCDDSVAASDDAGDSNCTMQHAGVSASRASVMRTATSDAAPRQHSTRDDGIATFLSPDTSAGRSSAWVPRPSSSIAHDSAAMANSTSSLFTSRVGDTFGELREVRTVLLATVAATSPYHHRQVHDAMLFRHFIQRLSEETPTSALMNDSSSRHRGSSVDGSLEEEEATLEQEGTNGSRGTMELTLGGYCPFPAPPWSVSAAFSMDCEGGPSSEESNLNSATATVAGATGASSASVAAATTAATAATAATTINSPQSSQETIAAEARQRNGTERRHIRHSFSASSCAMSKRKSSSGGREWRHSGGAAPVAHASLSPTIFNARRYIVPQPAAHHKKEDVILLFLSDGTVCHLRHTVPSPDGQHHPARSSTRPPAGQPETFMQKQQTSPSSLSNNPHYVMPYALMETVTSFFFSHLPVTYLQRPFILPVGLQDYLTMMPEHRIVSSRSGIASAVEAPSTLPRKSMTLPPVLSSSAATETAKSMQGWRHELTLPTSNQSMEAASSFLTSSLSVHRITPSLHHLMMDYTVHLRMQEMGQAALTALQTYPNLGAAMSPNTGAARQGSGRDPDPIYPFNGVDGSPSSVTPPEDVMAALLPADAYRGIVAQRRRREAAYDRLVSAAYDTGAVKPLCTYVEELLKARPPTETASSPTINRGTELSVAIPSSVAQPSQDSHLESTEGETGVEEAVTDGDEVQQIFIKQQLLYVFLATLPRTEAHLTELLTALREAVRIDEEAEQLRKKVGTTATASTDHHTRSSRGLAPSQACRLALLRAESCRCQLALQEALNADSADTTHWWEVRRTYAKELGEWSMVQFLFDIHQRECGNVLVHSFSGHVALHALGRYSLQPNVKTSSAAGGVSSLPTTALPSGCGAQQGFTNAHPSPSSHGRLEEERAALHPLLGSPFPTRDPTLFRLTPVLLSGLPLQSPFTIYQYTAGRVLYEIFRYTRDLIGIAMEGVDNVTAFAFRYADIHPQSSDTPKASSVNHRRTSASNSEFSKRGPTDLSALPASFTRESPGTKAGPRLPHSLSSSTIASQLDVQRGTELVEELYKDRRIPCTAFATPSEAASTAKTVPDVDQAEGIAAHPPTEGEKADGSISALGSTALSNLSAVLRHRPLRGSHATVSSPGLAPYPALTDAAAHAHFLLSVSKAAKRGECLGWREFLAHHHHTSFLSLLPTPPRCFDTASLRQKLCYDATFSLHPDVEQLRRIKIIRLLHLQRLSEEASSISDFHAPTSSDKSSAGDDADTSAGETFDPYETLSSPPPDTACDLVARMIAAATSEVNLIGVDDVTPHWWRRWAPHW